MKHFLALYIGSVTSREKARWDADDDASRQRRMMEGGGLEQMGGWPRRRHRRPGHPARQDLAHLTGRHRADAECLHRLCDRAGRDA